MSETTPNNNSNSVNLLMKVTLWAVLIGAVGVIGYVVSQWNNIQRDPEVSANIAKLETGDRETRLAGLEILRLIALEYASGQDNRKIVRAVPALALAAIDSDAEIRAQSLLILAIIGPEANHAQSAIILSLEDPEPAVRAIGAQAMAVVLEPEFAGSRLPMLLHDPDKNVVFATIKSLGFVASYARSAVPRLLELAQDEELRDEVVKALERIDPTALERLP